MRLLLILTAVATSTLTMASTNDALDVKIACREFVTGKLLAPSKAKFSSMSETLAEPDAKAKRPHTWDSLGHVDSQNAYGAMVRQKYLCSVSKVGERWVLNEIFWM